MVPDRQTQMMKGVLDICVLAILNEGPSYGYRLVTALNEQGLTLVAEGSVYPLLARLTKNGYVSAYKVPSPGGPPRKYYELTDSGREALAAGTGDWFEVSQQISKVLRGHNNVCQ